MSAAHHEGPIATLHGVEVLVAVATSSRTPQPVRELVGRYLSDRLVPVLDGQDDSEAVLAAVEYLEGRIATTDFVGQIARARSKWR